MVEKGGLDAYGSKLFEKQNFAMEKKHYRTVTILTRNAARKDPTSQVLPSSVSMKAEIVALFLIISWKHLHNKGGIAKNINILP